MRIAGTDEAGRGPLAGPVLAAAVILDPARPISGLADSKKLGAGRREQLCAQIQARALAWAVCAASVAEIDDRNILRAALLAMSRAIAALDPPPQQVLVDGLHCPPLAPSLDIPCRALVGGDGLEPCIAAASILAKVERDRMMVAYHRRYPAYRFDRHKGYPTRLHLQKLRQHGPSPIHRRSFAPVQQAALFG
ncbi:MAG: ribonuclease HII [Cellvibrionales bacterium]|nr:ribonuclease HII [Cellvibrionales bacterium]